MCIMLIVIVEAELFCIAAACFWWAARGYKYLIWRKK